MACRLWSGRGQRLRCSGGWQATGQDFRGAVGGATHLTTFLRLALSRLLSHGLSSFPLSILFMPSSHLHPP